VSAAPPAGDPGSAAAMTLSAPAARFWRDAPWLTSARLRRAVAAMLTVSPGMILWLLAGHGANDPTGRPVGTDFVDPWTVSWALLHGHAGLVYNPPALAALEHWLSGSSAFYDWEYPPSALLVVYPLALLPYLGSLALWLAAGLAGYLTLLWRIVPRPLTVWAGLAYPAVLLTVTHGQNSFLTTALFGWGLLLLPLRPAAAGMLFGALTFKPQLGLVLPVALVAGGHWRAIATATATAIVLAALPAVLFGAGIWSDFVASLPFTRHILESGVLAYYKMQSVFGAVRLLGGPPAAAYAVQGAAGTAAAVVVAWVWRRPVDAAVKNAALLVATPLATPYFLDYDAMLLAPAIAWLAARGLRGRALPWERTTMALVCLAVFVSRPVGLLAHVPLAPLAIAALLAVIVRRIRLEAAGLAGSAARPDGATAEIFETTLPAAD
jgi:alpha-1,2-mannosyltransferase